MTWSYFFLSVDSRTVWKFSRIWTSCRSGATTLVSVRQYHLPDGWDRARSSELHKQLGVIMDEKMTFSEHVDVMIANAFAMLGFIRRLSLEFRYPFTLKSLCTSLVRPKLEYASCVWNPFVLWCSCWQSGTRAVCSICFAWFGLDIHAWFDTLTKRRLLVWCLISMFWVEEWTHQTCSLSIWSHHDIRLAVPSFCVLISIERTMNMKHEPMSGAMRQFYEVIGHFDLDLTRNQFLNRQRLTL
jgi:hypothetical protein